MNDLHQDRSGLSEDDLRALEIGKSIMDRKLVVQREPVIYPTRRMQRTVQIIMLIIAIACIIGGLYIKYH